MSADGGEKKFELSDRRRQQLREEGSVARSHDVSTTTILGVGLSMLVWGGGMGVGNALTFGRLAGEEAAKYVLSNAR